MGFQVIVNRVARNILAKEGLFLTHVTSWNSHRDTSVCSALPDAVEMF